MKPTNQQQNMVVGLLTSPWSILVSVGIAAFIGIMFKGVAAGLRPFGEIYLYMIEMTVIPIIISAVISSVAGLAKSPGIRSFLVRMIVVFILMLIGVAVLGTIAGVIGNPGAGLDEQTRNTLGAIVKTQQSQYAPDLSISLSAPVVHKPQPGIIDFLVQMVPQNIFEALSSGRALELIFFSIIFGIAIGVLGAKNGNSLIELFDGLFKAFQKIISWLMVVLPIGLICLLSYQIASTGYQILLAMLKFIVIFYIVGIALFLVDVVIIWRRSRMPLSAVLKALLDPIIVSVVTRSSFAALPTAIKSLSQKLGFYERSTNLFFSLGVTIGRFGNILYFAIAALFVAQLYGASLGATQYGIVVIGSLFAGIATAGASGIATLNLLSIVLTPLGLPLEAVLIIFIAIDTIADPLRTMLIILTNMAANTFIVPRVEGLNRRSEGPARVEPVTLTVDVDLLTRVERKRELVVGVETREVPPFFSTGEAGGLSGIGVDLVQEVARRLGVQLRVDRTALTSADVVRKVHEGTVDLMLGSCNFHKVFEDELRYSDPYVTTQEAMLVDKAQLSKVRRGDENLLGALKTYTGRVGVVESSIHEKMAARVFPRASLARFPALEEMADVLFAGDILAAFGNEVELRSVLERRPTKTAMASIVVFNNLPADFRLAVAPRSEDALATINEVIASYIKTPEASLAE